MLYSNYVRRTTIDVATTNVIICHSGKYRKSTKGGGILISSDVIRGYNDTIILYLLQQNPSYGYEISKKIRMISEEKYIIKETTLYSAFTRMEKNGYLESFSGNETGGKRRTYYRVTEEGKLYYEEKCKEGEVTKEVVDKFIMKERMSQEDGSN